MLTLAIKNLKRNKLRTTITVLGIAIGSLLISIIIFTMISLRDLIAYHFAQVFEPENIFLVSFNPNTNFKTSDIEKIKDVKEVAAIYPAIELSFSIPQKQIGGKIVAYGNNYNANRQNIQKAIKEGKLVSGAIPIKKGHTILSKLLYDKLSRPAINQKLSVEINTPFQYLQPKHAPKEHTTEQTTQPVTPMLTPPPTMQYEFIVDGYVNALNTGEGPTMLISLDTAKEIVRQLIDQTISPDRFDQELGYNLLVVKATSTETVKEVTDTLEKKIFKDKDVIIGTAAEVIDSINKVLYILGGALLFVAFFSAVVASLGIINTMIMAVYEQKKEIGILKALGATNKQVFGLYALMSAFIGFLGGISGILLAIILFKAGDPLIVRFLNNKGLDIQHFFVYKLWVLVVISAASALVGLVAGVLPALKAARMDPIKAIRG